MPRRAVVLSFLLIMAWTLCGVRAVMEIRRWGNPQTHYDLRQLYHDESLFYRGIYPNARVQTPARPEDEAVSVYPAYGFVVAIPWIPPGLSWDMARVWFGLCQLSALVVVLGFAWRMGRTVQPGLGWLLVGATGAMTGLWADVLFGNFSALACAPLVGMYWALERERPRFAAVTWLGAMLKPQIGWVFSVFFLRRRNWVGLALGAGLLVTATVVSSLWMGVTPWRAMTVIYSREWIPSAADGHSLISLAGMAGVDPGIAQPVLGVLGLVTAGAALLIWTRGATLLARFAVIALIARLCVYHHTCDDLLLVFPILFIGIQAGRENRWPDWVIFGALCFSVWIPTALTEQPTIKAIVVLTWVAVLVRLLHEARTAGILLSTSRSVPLL
jgi:hypothetical protein